MTRHSACLHESSSVMRLIRLVRDGNDDCLLVQGATLPLLQSQCGRTHSRTGQSSCAMSGKREARAQWFHQHQHCNFSITTSHESNDVRFLALSTQAHGASSRELGCFTYHSTCSAPPTLTSLRWKPWKFRLPKVSIFLTNRKSSTTPFHREFSSWLPSSSQPWDCYLLKITEATPAMLSSLSIVKLCVLRKKNGTLVFTDCFGMNQEGPQQQLVVRVEWMRHHGFLP